VWARMQAAFAAAGDWTVADWRKCVAYGGGRDRSTSDYQRTTYRKGCKITCKCTSLGQRRDPDQVPDPVGEGRTGHGHPAEHEVHRPRVAGPLVDQPQRPADLLVA
jgi:hypothetical protein